MWYTVNCLIMFIEKGVSYMNKSVKRAVAAVIACLSLASFASCDIIKDAEEVTEDKTPVVNEEIPITKEEIVNYYNTVTNYLRDDANFNGNAPSVDIGEKINIDDIKITAPESDETPDALKPLDTAAKQIRNRILDNLNSTINSKASAGSVEYGKGGFKDVLSPSGQAVSALTVDDVVLAQCETESGIYNIDLYISSNSDSIKKVYDLPEKSAVLEEINKASGEYLTVADYTVVQIDRDTRAQYNAENPDDIPACQVHMTVDTETNKVETIEFIRIDFVNAPAMGKGSFESFGSFAISFRLRDSKTYKFIWTAPVTE